MEESRLFAFDEYADMASCLISGSNPCEGRFEVKRFANGEQYITLDTDVSGKRCFVLGSIAPPENNLFSFLLLCHTLRKEGASGITAILPYLAYTRHDKNESQKSHTTAFVAELFACAGVTSILTFDIHSKTASQLFSMPVTSLSPTPVFGEKIKSTGLQNTVLVAPDEGAIQRCKDFVIAAGLAGDIAYMVKKRREEGVVHTELHGIVQAHAIIIDDMLDTGGTLISSCRTLLNAGAKSIDIMVTHGLFTGDKWMQLWDLGVRDIYCTDTIPLSGSRQHPNIKVLSVGPYLKEAIRGKTSS